MQKKENTSATLSSHGDEAKRLARTIGHTLSTVGKGKFGDMVIQELANAAERGEIRVTPRGFVYKDAQLNADVAVGSDGDELLSVLGAMGKNAHKNAKGSLFSRIKRRLIPQIMIEDNIRSAGFRVQEELELREMRKRTSVRKE